MTHDFQLKINTTESKPEKVMNGFEYLFVVFVVVPEIPNQCLTVL